MRSPSLDSTGVLPSKRTGIYLLERCRVMEKDGIVVYLQAGSNERDKLSYYWNIPAANTSVVLLGQGSSITQAAARILSANGVMVGFTGTGGSPLFLASHDEYRPNDRLQSWIKGWPDPSRRVTVAVSMQFARIAFVEKVWSTNAFLSKDNVWRKDVETYAAALDGVSSIAELLGHEGQFTKNLYAACARSILDDRSFRRKAGEGESGTIANRFLDQGNYLAYGLASATLWTLGLPAGLPVSHGTTRRGGLVFDLADTIKDAVVMPVAFECAASADMSLAWGKLSVDYRAKCIARLHHTSSLETLFKAMTDAVTIMGE